jgi:hypothetical protein
MSSTNPAPPRPTPRVAVQLTTILAGQADRAAQEMTTQADQAQLPATRWKAVDSCCRYLNGHLDQLRYDIALPRAGQSPPAPSRAPAGI